MKQDASPMPIDFWPPERIAARQQELLQEHLRYCLEHSPFYRDRLRDVRPGEITLDTLRTLPLTSKEDLGACNDSFFAAAPERFADLVFSSGTTGIPTKIGYTESDLNRLAENERRSLAACGLSSEDIVLLTCTMDRCFIAGLAYFSGLRALGATAVRNGLGSLESHADVLRRTGATALIGVPGFLRKLALFLEGQGVSPSSMSVRRLICIGEPLRGSGMEPLPVCSDLEERWGAPAFSTYASSETITTFCECEARQGGHLLPDFAVVEIVDEQGRLVADGEPGEVVVTPLQIEGMPLIRFRTGDISFLIREPCACGRGTPRLGPILGRKNQLLKVKGTSLYPQAVFSVLDDLPEVSDYYLVVRSDGALSDQVTLHLSLAARPVALDVLAREIQARLRIRPEVIVETEAEIRSVVFAPGARKPVRFIDRRK